MGWEDTIEDIPQDTNKSSSWEDTIEDVPIGQRNLEKFGPADVSPSFLEEVLGKGATVAAGLSQGLTYKSGDEIIGGATAIGKDIGSLFSDEVQPGDYTAERDAVRASVAQAEAENPNLYLGSEIGGAVGGALAAPAAAAAKAVPAGVNLAKAIVSGAAYGAGAADELEDVPKAAVISGAFGGAASKAAPLVLGAVSKVLGGVKKGAEKLLDRPANKMANKVYEKSVEASTAARAARDASVQEAAETAARRAEIEAYATTLKAKKAYDAAYNRLKDTGRYSEEALEKAADKASDKIIDTAATRAEIAAYRATENAKIKADKLYDTLYKKSLAESKKALEKPPSVFGDIKTVGKGLFGGDTLGSEFKDAGQRLVAKGAIGYFEPTGTAAGLLTAKAVYEAAKGPLSSLGLKGAKALAGVGERSLRALSEAATRGPQATAATFNMLLQTDKKFREAITKNQESE